MRSPICHLSSAINSSPFNIASEKKYDLNKLIDDNNIIISFVNEPNFNIRVTKIEGDVHHKIVLPVACLEYLWAFSHFFWVFTQEYSKAQENNDENFDLAGNDRLRCSNELLAWAKINLQTTGLETWPEKEPKPEAHSQGSEDSKVATEIFLCAIAWIIHHEIAHVVLQHPLVTTAFSIQEERQADLHATDWILGGIPHSTPELKKRTLGIVAAVLCIQSLEVNTKNSSQNTHPNAYERIHYNTERYPVGNDQLIEALCTVTLQYIFNEKNINVNVDGESFSSILGDLLYDISRLTTS